jgi:hypothetical protein
MSPLPSRFPNFSRLPEQDQRTVCKVVEQLAHWLFHGPTGLSLTSEGSAFYRAKQRCTNPTHHKYPLYGARGVEFRYESLMQFLQDVGYPKPSPEYSIDRIDPDNHYGPGLCRWADAKTQAANRRPRRRKHNENSETKEATTDSQAS